MTHSDAKRMVTWVLLCCLTTAFARSDDWSRFLGPEGHGQSAETGLCSEWPSTGPEVIWKTPLGTGMSGIAVRGSLAVTLFQDDQHQYAVALDADSGSILWKTPVAPAYSNAMGHGPRATPTIQDDEVLVYSGEGILTSLTAADGQVRWQKNIPAELGGKPSEYGMSSSPLVVQDLIVVHAGTQQAAVVACERTSGRILWKAGQGAAGYSSPVLMTLGGMPQIVSFTGQGALGMQPETGEILWSYPFPTDYDCNTANPVQLSSTRLLISAGENHGSTILDLKDDGPGRMQVSPTWESHGRESQLRAEWQTPVLHDGHLYALDNLGSAGPITNLVCIRLQDMTTQWQKTRFGKANLICADGKLFLTNMDGDLVIVSASPAGFQETARARVLETTRQAPALSQGRLFVRDDQHVVCVSVRK